MMVMMHLNEKTLKEISEKTGRSEESLQVMLDECNAKNQIMRFKVWVYDGRIDA